MQWFKHFLHECYLFSISQWPELLIVLFNRGSNFAGKDKCGVFLHVVQMNYVIIEVSSSVCLLQEEEAVLLGQINFHLCIMMNHCSERYLVYHSTQFVVLLELGRPLLEHFRFLIEIKFIVIFLDINDCVVIIFLRSKLCNKILPTLVHYLHSVWWFLIYF